MSVTPKTRKPATFSRRRMEDGSYLIVDDRTGAPIGMVEPSPPYQLALKSEKTPKQPTEAPPGTTSGGGKILTPAEFKAWCERTKKLVLANLKKNIKKGVLTP